MTYKNEIVGGDGKRRYRLTKADGTSESGVLIEKDYTPLQEGSLFGAEEANALTADVNLTIGQSQEATAAANTAATAANTAATAANTAKTAADAATGKANEATTAANTAAGKATTEAGKATTAAGAANTAAAAANEATALLKDNKPVIDLMATGSGTAYTAQSDRVKALEAGMLFVIRFSTANTGAVTLNINSLGAKPVKQITSTGAQGDCIAGDFGKEQRYWLQYDGTVFYPVGASARAAKSGIWIGDTEPPEDAGYALWIDPSDPTPGELAGFGALNAGDIPKFSGDYLVPAVPGVDYGSTTGGDNATGNWTKLADGTLICWGELTDTQTDASGKIHITYPVAGANTLIPIVSPRWSNNNTIRHLTSSPTASGFDVHYFLTPSNDPLANAQQNVTWFAIGRWK